VGRPRYRMGQSAAAPQLLFMEAAAAEANVRRVARTYKFLYIPVVTEKPIAWLGSSLLDVRAFPKEARERVGYALDRVQRGLEPSDWKPMPSVGAGVREIRVKVGRQFRVLYVAKYAEAVYVLHAFEKKTQKTAQADLELARRRLARVRRSATES
jgi:phage-related protein